MNTTGNSLIVFSSKILAGIFIFLSQIILARALGPEGIGVYNLFLEVVGVALLFGGLGFGTASIYLSNKVKKDMSQLFSNSIIFGLIWGTILSVFIFFGFIFYPAVFRGMSYKHILVALIIAPIVIIYNYCMPLLLARFKVIGWSIFSVLYSLLILALGVWFVVIIEWGTDGAVYSVLITVLISFVAVFSYLLKFYSFKLHFDFLLFIDQLKFGISTYFGDIFSTINFKLNIFVVNIFLGIVNVGYYSVSYNIAALIFIIPYSLQQVLYPTWSSVSEKEVDQKTPRVARQVLILSFAVAILLALVGRAFILFFYGKEFLPSLTPFYLILPGGVCAAFAGIFFNNFFAKGKPHITSLILVASLLINILFNILFIPKIGVSGAALSASISYLFSAILALIFFWRITKTSLKEIVFIKRSDITVLIDRFSHLFTSVGKILNEVSSKDIKGLKEYYDKQADEYDVIEDTFYSSRLYKKIMYSSRIKKIMSLLDLKPTDRVLEIGSGEGYYTKKMLEKTKSVVATDISEKFLNKCQKNTQNMAESYICCPTEKLPFDDNSFDKILMSEVIEHLLDWRVGIKEIKRVLRPRGVVVISTPNKFSYFNVLCHIKILLRNAPFDGDHIKEFSRKELVGLLKNYFEVEDSSYENYFPLIIPKTVEKLINFETAQNFVRFVEGVLSHIIFVRAMMGLVFFIKARKK